MAFTTVTKTRPANTTAYTANDVIGDSNGAVWTFQNCGAAGQSIFITTIKLEIDIAANPGFTSFRLYLYRVSPASALADNAAFDLSSGDRPGYIGYVDLGSPADLGSTLFVQTDGVNKQLQMGAGDTNLYGYLVTTSGFTPAANSEVYVVSFNTVSAE
jgi:fermentation-respiration switch protein FrsA (DUF1100 family)